VALAAAGCSGAKAKELDPKAIEARYGLTGGYVDEIATEDGKIEATVVPTTLDDGRQVQLVIPHQNIGNHQVYMRDGITIAPLELSDPNVPKQQFVESRPRVVERRSTPVTTTKKQRSLEKEILIVGGSAGAGAAIGAVAGGGKGAGIGALSGGVAGLVYDLATRNKK
jgi:ribosomal protein S18